MCFKLFLYLYLCRNELCLIDWKTSSKPKPSIGDLYDYPLQTAAYLGAVNHDPGNNTQVRVKTQVGWVRVKTQVGWVRVNTQVGWVRVNTQVGWG